MAKNLFLWLFFLMPCYVFAQQPQLVQERNYLITSFGCDVMASAPDGAGNILYSGVAGLGTSLKLENKFLMVKPSTDTLWTWRNPLKLDDNVLALQTLSPGKFLAGGNLFSGQTSTMSLQRINSNKILGWSKNYISVHGMVSTILPMPGKDLLLGGYYQNNDFAFTRTDSVGNVKWSKSYSWGSLGEHLVDMKMTKNGNIIAIGNTLNTFSPARIKLLLINQNGDSLLGRELIVHGVNRNESVAFNFSSVTPLTTGGYLLTADVDTVTSAYPNGTTMGMVVKVDGNLNLEWNYVMRNPATDIIRLSKVKELKDGTLLVLGFKSWPRQNNNFFTLYRFSPNGQLMNTYPFTSTICNSLMITSLDALPDSTYMVGGSCGNNNPFSYGFYVAKVKIPGLPLPLPPFNISGVQEELLAANGLGQSYPNPTAAEAIIPYNLPKSYRKANIIIREIATGREVKSYVLKRNESSLKVDLSNFSNGLYLYSLVVDEKPIATKKLAVMK